MIGAPTDEARFDESLELLERGFAHYRTPGAGPGRPGTRRRPRSATPAASCRCAPRARSPSAPAPASGSPSTSRRRAEVEGPIEPRRRAGPGDGPRRRPAGRGRLPLRAGRAIPAAGDFRPRPQLRRRTRDPHRAWRVRDTDWRSPPVASHRSPEGEEETTRRSEVSPSDPHCHPERRDRPHGRGPELPPRPPPPRGREPHRRRRQGDQRRPRPEPARRAGDRDRLRRRPDRDPGRRTAARGVGAHRLHPDRRRDPDQPRGDRPDLGRADRDQRARPGGQPGGGRAASSSGSTTWRRRRQVCVLAGTLPPGAGDDLYARLVKDLRARGILVVLDAEGDAMLEGVRAGASVVTPNEQRGGGAGRAGVRRRRRPRPGPLRAGPAGRRGSGDHPPRRLRRGRSARVPSGASSRSGPSPSTRSRPSAPATPSSPATSPRATRAARPRSVSRYAVACGAESTQHFGAGTVDRSQVERLLGEVQVHDLEVPAEV